LTTHLIKVHGYTEKSATALLKTDRYQQLKNVPKTNLEPSESESELELFTEDYTEEEIESSQSTHSNPDTALILLDCETTGNAEARIVEIFCYDIISHAVFHYYVNPETTVHPTYGTAVHGYTIEFLQSHRIWKEVGLQWLDWLSSQINKKKTILVSHGSYDHTILMKECTRTQLLIPSTYKWIDSGMIIKQLLNTQKWALTDVAKQFVIDTSNAHSAAGDVFILWSVLQKLYERYVHTQPNIYSWLSNYALS
jgi:DNA polymerase III epsilon subunit-like protein